ncbi:MAG: hypothetical protein EXR92_03745 [Gemmatimonadetes bacterium]|nr:hypothetical protein [Gemmatimonadota bacterium]
MESYGARLKTNTRAAAVVPLLWAPFLSALGLLAPVLLTPSLLALWPAAPFGGAAVEAQQYPAILRFPSLGGADEDRGRLEQLLGERAVSGFLLRSPATVRDRLGAREGDGPASPAVSWALLAPELHTVWNSRLPFSLNEANLWAGRGVSLRLSAGAAVELPYMSLILAPEFIFEANGDFQTVAYPEADSIRERHALASPFHYPPGSMDLPQRFGTESRGFGVPGQSSVIVHAGAVDFGLATENVWWGPGIRNGLLLSANAPGFPHLFTRTASPIATRFGTVEAQWILGRLSESDYFDSDPSNDYRSLSAAAVVVRPAFEPGLGLGLARAVYAAAGDGLIPLGASLDFLRNVGRPSSIPGDSLAHPAPDQLLVVFVRWVLAPAGFELYGEWGRWEQPARSFRNFLELPQHSRGYTVGLQYAQPLGGRVATDRLSDRPEPRAAWPAFRLQVEFSTLEPSTSYRVRPFGEWYASRTVPQGYTHQGRVLGAAIGPSGSSQWLAGDVFAERWSVGGFAGRIRWENQAEFTYPTEFRRTDVSLFTGIRGGADLGWVHLQAEYAAGVRLNYLFQAVPVTPTEHRGVDIRNHTLKLTLSTGSKTSVPRP